MGSSEQRFNYRGLRLIKHVVKVMECVVKGLIRQRDKIDEMQCDFTHVRPWQQRCSFYYMTPTGEAHNC